MIDLARYIGLIVDPTFEDFKTNPESIRHGYLACVATYHAIDRAALPDDAHVLQGQWRSESLDFALVEEVATHFKHPRRHWVKKAKDENPDRLLITRPLGLEGDGEGLETRNLHFVIRDAIKFLRTKIT